MMTCCVQMSTLVFFVVYLQSYNLLATTANGSCTQEMFGDDSNAFLACQTQYALQRNWFPSPIAGLFSYQVWNGFDGFWQNGAVLEPMVNFMVYANNSRYKRVVKSSWRDLYSLLEAYAPQPSYDDMGWYGLSYVRAYEVFGWQEFLDAAKRIYDWCWQNGWDRTGQCQGGFWFDQTLGSKQTITNVQMLQLAAKLYRLTNKTNGTLLDQVKLTWRNFIVKNKIINETTFQVADGITWNCTNNQVYGPTYNSGVLIGGLVEMYKIKNQSEYLELAYAVANSTIARSSVKGVLTEWCDAQGCDDDAKVFKGIFVRNLRYLLDTSTKSRTQVYSNWLQYNINSVLKHSSCNATLNAACIIDYRDGRPFYNRTGPVFGSNWRGPFNFTAPMQQTAVLDLFVSAIQAGTSCIGVQCSYDPPTPPPRKLTCDDHPCPTNEQCCAYQSSYYTCCNADQKCVNGYCE